MFFVLHSITYANDDWLLNINEERRGLRPNMTNNIATKPSIIKQRCSKFDYQESYATRNLTVIFRYMCHGTP